MTPPESRVESSPARHPLLPLLAIAALASLGVAVWIGLSRLGFDWGRPPGNQHGLLMVIGFLGTVIGVERAVALDRAWAWLTPLLSAIGAAGLIFGWSPLDSIALLAAGAILVAVYATAIVIVGAETHLLIMGMGAIAWVVAVAGFMLGRQTPSLIPVLVAFLVLTIAGERLELSRLGRKPPRWWKPAFTGSAMALLAAGAVSLADLPIGSVAGGIALLTLAAVASYGDIARRTIRFTGVTRYMAAALLAGYGWMALGGGIWLLGGLTPGTSLYDAAIHTILVGFVLSMVFAHAPVIVPAVAGVELPYRSSWWLALGLLHGSMALRFAGDLSTATQNLEVWGAVGNVTAIVVFIVLSAYSAASARRRSGRVR